MMLKSKTKNEHRYVTYIDGVDLRVDIMYSRSFALLATAASHTATDRDCDHYYNHCDQ
jgi:hypothetical protein